MTCECDQIEHFIKKNFVQLKNRHQIILTQKKTQFLHNNSRSKMSRPQITSSSSTTMKKFDYSDHHYRDAICRLKVMLSDSSTSYVPPKFSSSSSSLFKTTAATDDDTDTTENTIVERSMSKSAPYKSYSTYSMASSTYKPSKHLQVPCKSCKPELFCILHFFIFG